jgi:hypothetical protein
MITGKAYKRINILRKFKFILDRKTLEKIYFAFVRPLQSWIFVKSLFRESAVSFGSCTIRYKLASSANSFIVDCTSVTMSFIKNINKRGPGIEPWGTDISTVSEHKHLGLVISENESWEKHTDMITAYKRINILRKFKYILDRKTLEKIYFAFVRPLLEYFQCFY